MDKRTIQYLTYLVKYWSSVRIPQGLPRLTKDLIMGLVKNQILEYQKDENLIEKLVDLEVNRRIKIGIYPPKKNGVMVLNL